MSGIVGLFRRDGAPAEQKLVQAMAAKLAHRGPDGSSALCAGPAGLGHTMLWTTPESLHEVLPRHHAESALTITADARIDNRDELIAELGIGCRHPAITDSELILEAYRKWGQQCPEKLIGDFVFAIWDSSRQQFFCARDPMGVKCVYYFLSGFLFAFGSEIKALNCLPEIPKDLNELRILDYLDNVFDDRAITFYKNIWRLPSASTLVVGRGSFRTSKYWSLDPERELKLKSADEYTEAFRDCFTQAVRVRMRSAFPVGSALSGGLDSSSIACVARRIRQSSTESTPVHTFSLIFPSLPEHQLRHIDEREYMQDVLALGGFKPHFIEADRLSPLNNVEAVHWHLDEATCAPNLYLHWAMYERANREGVRVFLDGFDGDTTLSYGFGYLRDLAVGLRWKTLWHEARMLARNLRSPTKTVIFEHCAKPLCPGWLSALWRKAHGRPPDPTVQDTFLVRPFKQRMGFEKRVRLLGGKKRWRLFTARSSHMAGLEMAAYAYALELTDKASAAFGVEARYPFFDRRLIELCLSLPAEQKLGRGWSRWILRRAMTSYLPESVQWRSSKANLSPNFDGRLVDRDRDLLDDVIIRNSSELEPYVDLVAIRKAYETYKQGPLWSNTSMSIFAAANLALWLRRSDVVSQGGLSLTNREAEFVLKRR